MMKGDIERVELSFLVGSLGGWMNKFGLLSSLLGNLLGCWWRKGLFKKILYNYKLFRFLRTG